MLLEAEKECYQGIELLFRQVCCDVLGHVWHEAWCSERSGISDGLPDVFFSGHAGLAKGSDCADPGKVGTARPKRLWDAKNRVAHLASGTGLTYGLQQCLVLQNAGH